MDEITERWDRACRSMGYALYDEAPIAKIQYNQSSVLQIQYEFFNIDLCRWEVVEALVSSGKHPEIIKEVGRWVK